MTRDVRIVLLVGLIFIFLFGLVLGDRTLRLSDQAGAGPPAAAPPPPRPGPEVMASRMTPSDDRPVLAPRRRRSPTRRTSPAGSTHLARRAPASSARTPSTPVPADRVLPGPVPMTARRHPADAATRRGRVYTVQPGDKLILIARRFWGRRNQSKYRLIFEANRDKLTDEDSLDVGQELVIPPLPGAEAPGRRRPGPASPAGPTAMRHYREVGLAELPGQLRRRWYVVRPGDRLTDIARRQMADGSVRAVRRLYEANRDRIADPDVLPVGLRLRIPR